MDKKKEELVWVRLTQRWSLLRGGTYNPGERVAFPRNVANTIVEKNCGVIEEKSETSAAPKDEKKKEVSSPPKNKMVQSAPRKRSEVIR